ncbi:MAG: LCP family protein [Armatimonadota bacterium]
MRTSTDYILYMLVFAVISGGAYGVYDAVSTPPVRVEQARQSDTWQTNDAHLQTPDEELAGIVRIVLIGADDREGETGRSDTLMVAFINPARSRLALMSIPRDLRVRIPGHGYDKVNAAYAAGGPPLTVETVKNFLDEDIDHWAKIDFEGFVNAVDTLGGVEVTVPDIEGSQTGGQHHGMNYDDNWGNLHIHLKPGRQKLDGEEALGFVRYRKSNVYRNRRGVKYRAGINDIERAKNQQTFLQELIKQKLRVTNLPNLVKAGSQILGYLETDRELTWMKAYHLFKIIRQVKPSEIYTMTVPIRDRWISNGEQEIYYAEVVRSTFRERRSEMQDYLYGRERSDVQVTVLNGCGRAGIAATAADLLNDRGFNNVKIGNAARFDHTITEIVYYGDTETTATRIARLMDCGRLTHASADEDQSGVEIIVGEDFQP